MSKRPILNKRANRVRKALRPGLTRNMDLVEFLITRRHAQTRGAARKMLEEGKVRVDSHPVGRINVPMLVKPFKDGEEPEVENRWIAQPIVSADLRDRLMVTS